MTRHSVTAMNIQQNHKSDLKVLIEQPDHVVIDFCKLARNFLLKGSNVKLYQVASQKLDLEVSEVKSAVEGLVYLFIEANQNELNKEVFKETAVSFGFPEEIAQVLHDEYLNFKPLLDKALPQTSVVYPQFSNLEWRFETQISSRSIRNEMTPRVLMKLELEEGNKKESVCLQSDIPNIIHMSEVLNQALQESRTNHSRKIHRTVS